MIELDRHNTSRLRKTDAILSFMPEMDAKPRVHEIGGGYPFTVSEETMEVHRTLVARDIDAYTAHRDAVFDVATELYGVAKPVIAKGRKPTKEKAITVEVTPSDARKWATAQALKKERFYEGLGEPLLVQTPGGAAFIPYVIGQFEESLTAKGLDARTMPKGDLLRAAYAFVDPADPVLTPIKYIEEVLRTQEDMFHLVDTRDFPVWGADGRTIGYTSQIGWEVAQVLAKIGGRPPEQYKADEIIQIVKDILDSRAGKPAPEKPAPEDEILVDEEEETEAPKRAKASRRGGDKAPKNRDIPFAISVYSLLLSGIQILDGFDKLPGHEDRRKKMVALATEFEKLVPEYV